MGERKWAETLFVLFIVLVDCDQRAAYFMHDLGIGAKGSAIQFLHSRCVPGGHADISPVSRRNHLFPDNRAPS